MSNVINLFIVCELDRWSQDLSTDFMLKACLDLQSMLIQINSNIGATA